MKIGFLFAGQGAQAVGMGKDLYDSYETAKQIYDKFPEIKKLCFEGPEDILNQTAYAQKAMLLTSYVYATLLKENGIEPTVVAGLSLGEYSALAFADVWNLDDAIEIVSNRGRIMQNALPLGTSKMAAIIGLERTKLEEVVKSCDGIVEVANYNCPGQIVITGENTAVDNAMEKLKEAGALKVVPLNVSGAFHSSLLNNASKELRVVLDKFEPKNPKYDVVYNITGKKENKPINDILEAQICHSVYFEDSIRLMMDECDCLVEIGPGKSLQGFCKRINRSYKCYNVTDLASLKQTLDELKA